MQNQDIIALLESQPGTIKTKMGPHVLQMLFTHSQSKVVFADGVIGRFGCGSMILSREVVEAGDNRSQPYVIDVGHYCESAHSKILLGSEHRNDLPINITFSQSAALVYRAKGLGTILQRSTTHGPVKIGHGVVISQDAKILSGITIGNGAVIAAGAIVTKDVPDYAIVGGVPAKLIRYRFDEKTRESLNQIRWWDLKIGSLLHYYDAIQSLPQPTALKELLNLSPSHYRQPSENYWVYLREINQYGQSAFTLAGAEMNKQFYGLQHLPPLLKFYEQQRQQPKDSLIYVAEDIFELARQAMPVSV